MTWRLIEADCIEAMQQMEDSSVNAIVTDPPYGLEFMGKEWDRLQTVAEDPASIGGFQDGNGGNSYSRSRVRYALGAGMQEWHHAWATEALRVLKPGGHLLAFGGTRTYHRLACAIEDAGFEIRDCLAYMYGSGFPKSHNLDRLRDSPFCRCREGESNDGDGDLRGVREGVRDTSGVDQAGEGTPLQSSVQRPRPVPRTRQALRRRSSGVDRDQLGFLSGEDDGSEQSSVEGRRDAQAPEGELQGRAVRASADVGAADGTQGRLHHGAPAGHGADGGTALDPDGGREPHRPQSVEQRAEQPGTVADEPRSQAGGVWPVCERCSKPRLPRGLGTALKPAFEPIVLARKPLVGTVAANVLEHGVGALNIDGTRIETDDVLTGSGTPPLQSIGADNHRPFHDTAEPLGVNQHPAGRWPANVLLDEDSAAFLDEQTGELKSGANPARRGSDGTRTAFGEFGGQADANPQRGVDVGGASRFFYVSKADRSERERGVEHRTKRALNWSSGTQAPGAFQAEGTERNVGNAHPTVKPVELMQWLCRLVTPPGGVVLDPFTGSGSTGIAALREGFSFIGIEREAEYVEIARDRIIGDAPLFNVSTEVT